LKKGPGKSCRENRKKKKDGWNLFGADGDKS